MIFTQNLFQRVLYSFHRCHLVYSDFIYMRYFTYIHMCLCPSAHRFVCTQDVPLQLIQAKVGCAPRHTLKSQVQKELKGVTLKTVKWLLNLACKPCPESPRSLCPQDQWWPNWDDALSETLRMGGGPWTSEVGTSGLGHTDYILVNKLNVPRAVLWRWSLWAGMVYAHSALLPFVRITTSKMNIGRGPALL